MSTTTTTMDTAVRERPILFSGPMVRAIHDGSKTQTRRAIKPQPHYSEAHGSWMWSSGRNTWDMNRRREVVTSKATGESTSREYAVPVEEWLVTHRRCPFAVGMRLWVKERFRIDSYCSGEYGGIGEVGYPIRDISRRPPDGTWVPQYRADGEDDGPWRPSIHMPRWASRITLEVTAVRVERLQEITEADAVAEGVAVPWHGGAWPWISKIDTPWRCAGQADNDPRLLFSHYWDARHGRGAWAANPWVWALTFRRIDHA